MVKKHMPNVVNELMDEPELMTVFFKFVSRTT